MNTDPGNRRPIAARSSRHAAAFARWLVARGVTPNQVSLFGLATGVGSGLALALAQELDGTGRVLLVAAAILVLLRGLSNMFDGMVAVEHAKGTPTGILYNEVPDRLSDVSLFVGAGYALGGDPVIGWAAACCALLVTCIRFIGTVAGAPADFGGPMAKQQRMFSVAGASAYLGMTPVSWHPAMGQDGRLGLLGIVLCIVIAGSLLTCHLRIRRAAAALHAKVAHQGVHQ